VAGLMLASAACHRVVAVQQPLAYIAANNPKVIWVTTHDGTEFAVRRPQVAQGDSVAGYVGSDYRTVPLAPSQQVRVRQNAQARTLVLIGAGLMMTAGIVYFVSGQKSTPFNFACIEDPDDSGGCMTSASRGYGW